MTVEKLINLGKQQLNAALLAVLLLFYVASGFSGKSFAYLMLLFLAALLYVGCGVLLYTTFKGADKKNGHFRLLQLAYWLMLAAVFFYTAQADAVWQKVAGESVQTFYERLRQILQILYFTGFATAIVTLLLSMAVKTEARGATQALVTGGGLLVLLVALNYWAHIRPASVDMTLMRRFSLSADSRELLRGIDGEIKVTAFYPFFSEMYRDVELMLRDAAAANAKISYTFIDPLREKNLADEKKVDRIGTILLEAAETEAGKGPRSTRFEILDEDAIKRFERELVSNILQISGKRKNIYYSQGHEEKSVSGPFADDTIAILDENLRALRHHVKQLTPQEGFPGKMPEADAVLIIGPRRDFTLAEKTQLKKYFDAGGKILVAVDPESAADFSFLLGPLKVKLAKERLHSDYALPPGKTTLQSANYSEHAITAPFVKRPEERKLTVFPGAGYFETGSETNADYDINYFVLSHFTSWVDTIRNGMRDDKKEPLASFKIGLAAKAKNNSGRLIFLTDSDFMVNRYIDMQQNKELALRTIAWLAEDEKLTGIVAGKYDDEKVKLTGAKDTVIFHLFLYIYPGLILLVGYIVVRNKKRRLTENREA
ncbi:DUF4350 domain-containing protein [Turneriella parva]|uniref:ABC-type uncharacterized transport system n=1 Tax=Turneriella parva (strain ATCC BAA-1111 / DSM 21527 / NCTC 11395 / H) TaxID=869212 RepID=I4B7U8_TURPD|nr:DUF4350 domain-containing protein [Turneriella parva]AFM13355.1 ABC-type uncharacterized transport system [Turneriella parva DSM 21527]